MTKKFSILVASLTLAIVAIFSFGIFAHNNSNSAQTPQTKPVRKDIPDEVVYRHLFRVVNDFKKQADDLERDGKDATSFRTHFKHRANLTDLEAEALNEVASQCAAEMRAVEARVKLLIATARAQFPDGHLPFGQKPPAPPEELKQLSAERDSIVLRARDNLRMRFGADEFTRFHTQYVKGQVAQNLQPAGTN
jgi:MFS superfamily sulfate permease-like transporter